MKRPLWIFNPRVMGNGVLLICLVGLIVCLIGFVDSITPSKRIERTEVFAKEIVPADYVSGLVGIAPIRRQSPEIYRIHFKLLNKSHELDVNKEVFGSIRIRERIVIEYELTRIFHSIHKPKIINFP